MRRMFQGRAGMGLAFILGLLIATAGTATAARLITGKQIKDGSVGSKDLTKDVQKLLKKAGNAGGAGPQGPQGVSGQPGPATGAAGGDLSGSYPNPTIAPGAVGPAGLAAVPAVMAYRASADQAVEHISSVELQCNAESFDTQNLHDPVTNPGQMKAPIDGLYQISAGVIWATNAIGDRTLLIRREPAQSTLAMAKVGANTVGDSALTGSALVGLKGGTTGVSVRVSQTSGFPLAAKQNPGTFCAMHWIGPLPR